MEMKNNTFVEDSETIDSIFNCFNYLDFAPYEIRLKYKELIQDESGNLHPDKTYSNIPDNFSKNDWINLENELKNEVGPYMEKIKNLRKLNKRDEKKFQKKLEAEEKLKKAFGIGLLYKEKNGK